MRFWIYVLTLYQNFDFTQKFLSWCRNFCMKSIWMKSHFFGFSPKFDRNFWQKFLHQKTYILDRCTTYFNLSQKYVLAAILGWFEVWGKIKFFEKKSHKWKISKISVEISASKQFHFFKFFKVSTLIWTLYAPYRTSFLTYRQFCPFLSKKIVRNFDHLQKFLHP